MPCNICNEVFKVKPCEQSDTTTLTIDTSLFLLNSKYINDVIYKVILLPHITAIFHDHRTSCPCKECIVRSACTTGSNCDHYKEIVNRNQPISNIIEDNNDNELGTFKLIDKESYESEV